MFYSLDSQYQGLRLWLDAHIYFHIGVPPNLRFCFGFILVYVFIQQAVVDRLHRNFTSPSATRAHSGT